MEQHCRWLAVVLITLMIESLLPVWPAAARDTEFCQQLPAAIAAKATLLRASLKGDRIAQTRYQAILATHAKQLRQCRQRNYPRTEALWIRLYPCDARPGVLDAVFDRIVNRGYNQVNIEVFGGGKVLLPANGNPTPWIPVLAGTRVANVDLFAAAIRKGRERGLKVYGWLFTLNVGTHYLRRADRQQTLARNGFGQTSLTVTTAADPQMLAGKAEEAFLDPYSNQARRDYLRLVQAIVQRRPDGILFDYVRYPRGSQAASVASKVQDLWIYGEASRSILLRRALNYKGMELMLRYLNQGFISANDLSEVDRLFPQEQAPLWQGRTPDRGATLALNQRADHLQAELWQLSLAHAFQGILDFLNLAVQPAKRAKVPVGVVFFPEGNQTVGGGYDSRLQFWEHFPRDLEWHPMLYGVCGRPDCIMAQIQRVLTQTPQGTQVKPVLAGIWQKSVSNRPPLEVQMRELYRVAPQLQTVSHFAYSWQEPGSDRDRKACQP